MCRVTTFINPDYLLFILNILIGDGKVKAYSPHRALDNLRNATKIVINGQWFGSTEECDLVFM